MRKLKFIQACPDDNYYLWQVHLWVESLKNLNHSDKAISLIFTPRGRQRNEKWKMLVDLYPEAEFHFYDDEHNVTNLIPIYIPVLRPYVLWKHFKNHPELVNDAIFYCDADVIFTQNFNVDHLIQDDLNYLSDTKSYINADYFESKVKDVIPEKKELFLQRDVLAEVTSLIGITKEIAIAGNNDSGGAQYLLKNITSDFWSKVMNDCILIRSYLQKVNREFFENENKGYQSWCADMWSVLWNLWFGNRQTRIVDEMNFAWATDPIEKLRVVDIMHNAGVVSSEQDGIPFFYKGLYHIGTDPFQDGQIEKVLNSEKSKTRCTWFYTNELMKIKTKYNLTYS